MFGLQVNSQPKWVQFQAQSQSRSFIFGSRNGPTLSFDRTQNHFSLPSFRYDSTRQNQKTQFSVRASSASVGSTEFIEEPATKVSFRTTLNLPGCSSPLSLLGTGVREKIFAIIGVKVYAAALYANPSVFTKLDSETREDSSLFKSIFQAPLEKSLQIVLVRDVDGKTFWDALDEAVSPRIKSPTQLDESALSTFRTIFRGKSLKKGTFIFLTWLDSSKMLISVSSDGIPSTAGTTIESENVTSSLFDVFFGDTPVSPSLKASVASALATSLK